MRLQFRALSVLTSLLALSVFPAPVSARTEVARFALVVGNNQPPAGTTSTLRYADDDAVAMHRLLVQAGVESRLLVRLDRDSRRLHGPLEAAGAPRAADLARAVGELTSAIARAKARGNESELLIFYSGHGDIDAGEGFVMLEDQRLTRRRLFELLKSSKATRNHVFIDACRSYFLVFDRGPGGQRRRYSGAPPQDAVPSHLANTGFVLSTSSDRESHEWERFQGGILSHELRSALRGAADTNLDGAIDYGELGAFLTTANRSIENPRFRPSFTVRPPAGNFRQSVLAWRGTAPLVSSRNDLGHFYVETARGERILDAHPAAGQALRLWPPPERPLFVRPTGGAVEYVVQSGKPTDLASLAASPLEVASRGALSLAFERLFADSFGTEDVWRYEAASDRLPEPPANPAGPDGPGGSDRTRVRLQFTLGTIAIVAEATALSLNAAAAIEYWRSSGDSQRELETSNERVHTLNRASLPFHATAALAGLGWGLSRWWPESVVVDAGKTPGRPTALSVVWYDRF